MQGRQNLKARSSDSNASRSRTPKQIWRADGTAAAVLSQHSFGQNSLGKVRQKRVYTCLKVQVGDICGTKHNSNNYSTKRCNTSFLPTGMYTTILEYARVMLTNSCPAKHTTQDELPSGFGVCVFVFR